MLDTFNALHRRNLKSTKQMIKDTVCLPKNLDTGSILVLAILGGGFILGVWFILIRRDAALEVRQGAALKLRVILRCLPIDGRTRTSSCAATLQDHCMDARLRFFSAAHATLCKTPARMAA